jgi:hypothetical protein
MKKAMLLIFCFIIIISPITYGQGGNSEPIIKNASMPSVVKDANGMLGMVFTRSNQLQYAVSSDNGITFSLPVTIDTLKDIFGVAGRGPQVVNTLNGLCILAPDKTGNIYSYSKDIKGHWQKTGKVNDVDAVAKEGFVSVASYNNSVYAVWLDLRGNSKNKIVGSLSVDGGKHWLKNEVIYQSPGGSVCECCKPSVSFTNDGINLMFRNLVNGNRDLYLIHSKDGSRFNKAVKLGEGNWKLNACPMDGGGIVAHDNGTVQTVWRRVDTVFSCAAGAKEQMIGKGKNCTIEKVGNENIYAWIEASHIVCLLPGTTKIKIGEGSFPVLKAINQKQVLCIWQFNNNIFSKLLSL